MSNWDKLNFFINKNGRIVTFTSELLAALVIMASGLTYMVDKFYLSERVLVDVVPIISNKDQASFLLYNNSQFDVVIKSAALKTRELDLKREMEVQRSGLLLKKNSSLILNSIASSQGTILFNEETGEPFNFDTMFDLGSNKCFVEVKVIAPNVNMKTITSDDFDCGAVIYLDWKVKE